MAVPYVTLEDFRRGKVALTPLHLENLKQVIGRRVRADWKKYQISVLDFDRLRSIPDHWSFRRIVFYPNGECEYTASQDYNSEIQQVRDAIIGKRK